jgi:hypothetical protein
MTDRIRDAFLVRQLEEGRALAAESDLLHLVPSGEPADRYVARFSCRGLVERPPHSIVEWDRFEVGIWFPRDYLRVVDPFRVVSWLGPRGVWHPNIASAAPVICVGRLVPGTGLVDILYQVFEVITWNKVTMREDDALNKAACQWARQNRHKFPVDERPLKRRSLDLHIEETLRRSEPDGQQK